MKMKSKIQIIKIPRYLTKQFVKEYTFNIAYELFKIKFKISELFGNMKSCYWILITWSTNSNQHDHKQSDSIQAKYQVLSQWVY